MHSRSCWLVHNSRHSTNVFWMCTWYNSCTLHMLSHLYVWSSGVDGNGHYSFLPVPAPFCSLSHEEMQPTSPAWIWAELCDLLWLTRWCWNQPGPVQTKEPPKNQTKELTHEINKCLLLLVTKLWDGLLYALFVGYRYPFTDENTKAQWG